jgi:hypothetical protein
MTRSSIDRAEKNYKITILEGRNQEKEKNYSTIYTPTPPTHKPRRRLAPDRPPLRQYQNTAKICQNPTLTNDTKPRSFQIFGIEGERVKEKMEPLSP